MLTKREFLSSALAFGLGSLATRQVCAGDFPTHPIRFVVPFPPGNNSDLVVRLIAERLQATLGQPVVIEHRPGGAGGTVGAKAVANADPDGYTLLLSPPTPLVVAPAIYSSLGYDPATAFAPVASLFSTPQLLVVNPAVAAETMADLVAYAKRHPAEVKFASPGYGTQPHLLGEMFRLEAGIEIVHVPYKGPAQAVTDLLAGEVQMYFETAALLLPHVQAGKLRVLAVADGSRLPQLPTAATTAESGFPKLQATFWAGIVAPVQTPASIVDKLNFAINDILKMPEVQARLAQISAKAKIESPNEFAAFMTEERAKWTEIARATGIKAD